MTSRQACRLPVQWRDPLFVEQIGVARTGDIASHFVHISIQGSCVHIHPAPLIPSIGVIARPRKVQRVPCAAVFSWFCLARPEYERLLVFGNLHLPFFSFCCFSACCCVHQADCTAAVVTYCCVLPARYGVCFVCIALWSGRVCSRATVAELELMALA